MDRRTFLALMASLPLLGASGYVYIREWRLFAETRPDQVAPEPKTIPLDLHALRLAALQAPLLPYDARLSKWEIRSDAGNCAVRSLTVRAWLARLCPLGAIRPAICFRGEEFHMVLCVVTDGGDYIIDSIGNILRPMRETSYRLVYRYHAGLKWSVIDADMG